MAEKAPDAFRTISEVANWLDVPAHVLRFWESKFPQIKPVKRAGGRRYYRPSDMQLIGGIKKLLHDDGLTIRGVQKMIKEDGVKSVAAQSPEIDMPSESEGAARRKARRARRAARQTAQGKAPAVEPTDMEAAPDAQGSEDPAPEAPFTHVEQEDDPTGGDNIVALNGGSIADALPDTPTPDDTAKDQQAEFDLDNATAASVEDHVASGDEHAAPLDDKAPDEAPDEAPLEAPEPKPEAHPAQPDQRPAMLDNPFMPRSKSGAEQDADSEEETVDAAAEATTHVPNDPDPKSGQATTAQRHAAEQMQRIRRLDAGTELAAGSEQAASAAYMRLKALRDRIAADIAKH